jgi:hypothetical protein
VRFQSKFVVTPRRDTIQIPFVDLKAQYLSIQEEINEAIQEVLHSAQFVNGKWVEGFEQEFADYLGVPYIVGVGSGTAALELYSPENYWHWRWRRGNRARQRLLCNRRSC